MFCYQHIEIESFNDLSSFLSFLSAFRLTISYEVIVQACYAISIDIYLTNIMIKSMSSQSGFPHSFSTKIFIYISVLVETRKPAVRAIYPLDWMFLKQNHFFFYRGRVFSSCHSFAYSYRWIIEHFVVL